jgi:nucleotide-binding universal stress UspA family protein
LGETGVAVAANTFLPWGLGAILLVIGAVLSTMSALNATTFSSTRVSFAMGRDRFLPAALSHVSPKTRTPTIALAASGVLIVSVAILLDAEMVASATCAMFLLVFAMVNISSIVIRRKYGDKLHYGYLVPGGPVIPIVAAIGQVVLVIWLLSSQPLMLWLTVGWVAIGLGIYYSWSRSQEHAFRASPVIYEQTPHVLTSTHQVLVPVANPATAGSLVELAARLTDPTDTAVTVLNVVKVPEQLPFGSTEPFVKEGRVVVEKAMAITETMGREVAGLVRVSRHPGQAIVETVAERKIDTLVMGWTGPKRRPRRMRTIVIGEQIDTVIRRADCDTVILRGSVPSEPKRIVVPVAHPKQGRFAIGIAAHLAGPSTIIEAVRVVASPNDKKSAEKRLHVDLFGEDGSPDLPGVEWPVELTIVVASDITDALVEAGDRADILILGASMGGWRGSMFSPIQYGVAERWQGPLLLVRMRSGAAKFAAHRTIDFLVSTEPEA